MCKNRSEVCCQSAALAKWWNCLCF